MVKIYTKTGDAGETQLLSGQKVNKSSLQINAYGQTDELNAFIGLLLSGLQYERDKKILFKVQNMIFNLGALLASDPSRPNKNLKKVDLEIVSLLEERIDEIQNELPELKNFILPGGSNEASLAHVCRTVCRRAERIQELYFSESKVSYENAREFLNRLSDYFFVLSRYLNAKANIEEILWAP